jgi:hypothetical protein
VIKAYFTLKLKVLKYLHFSNHILIESGNVIQGKHSITIMKAALSIKPTHQCSQPGPWKGTNKLSVENNYCCRRNFVSSMAKK